MNVAMLLCRIPFRVSEIWPSFHSAKYSQLKRQSLVIETGVFFDLVYLLCLRLRI